MGRRRTASDEAVFQALERAAAGVGPSALSLVRVAANSGVTAGALVQRFGSKAALVAAYCNNRRPTVAATNTGGSVLSTLRAGLVRRLPAISSPTQLCNLLAFRLDGLPLQELSVAELSAVHQDMLRLIEQAVEDGELRTTETESLADVLTAVWYGSQLSWALSEGQQSLETWVMSRVNSVLDAHQLHSSLDQPEPDLMGELTRRPLPQAPRA